VDDDVDHRPPSRARTPELLLDQRAARRSPAIDALDIKNSMPAEQA